MPHHACFAVPDHDLDVAIVDDSRTMQGILRSVLAAMKVKRIRVFDSPESALHTLLADPPNLILTEWVIGAASGQQFLRTLRTRVMDPLCFVPVIVVAATATTSMLERAMAAGTHLVMIKPVSPSALMSRIAWLQRDDRLLSLGQEGRYEIDGVRARLQSQLDRSQALRHVVTARIEQMPVVAAPRPDEDEALLRQSERWRAFLKAKEKTASPGAVLRVPETRLPPAWRGSHPFGGI